MSRSRIRHVKVSKSRDISGRYLLKNGPQSAELSVVEIPGDRVKITGSALWGEQREFGPNVGTIAFETPILPGPRVVFTDTVASHGKPTAEYRLEIAFDINLAFATEQSAPGYFGLNVSFGGEYRRVKD